VKAKEREPETEMAAAPVRPSPAPPQGLLDMLMAAGNLAILRLLGLEPDNNGAAAAPAPAAPAAQDGITETTRVRTLEILHAEEIFRDVGSNTVDKKRAFNRLNKAIKANNPTEIAEATEALKKFIVTARLNRELRPLRNQLAAAKKKKAAKE